MSESLRIVTVISALFLLCYLNTSAAETNPSLGTRVGKVLGIAGRNAWVTRSDGTRSQLRTGDICLIGDKPEAGDDTTIVLEFAISGQAQIAPNTAVEIIGRRETRELGKRFLIEAKTLWAKIDKQKETLQIQTAGGVIGVEG